MQHEVRSKKMWEGSAQGAAVVSGGEQMVNDGTVMEQQHYLCP